MKNIIMVDVDSDRPNQVIFNKPNDFVMPTNEADAKQVVIDDLKTLAHGLGCLIKIAHERGYGDSREMLDETIELLSDYYPPSEVEQALIDLAALNEEEDAPTEVDENETKD